MICRRSSVMSSAKFGRRAKGLNTNVPILKPYLGGTRFERPSGRRPLRRSISAGGPKAAANWNEWTDRPIPVFGTGTSDVRA
jgi:hypothetical protein